MSEAETRTSNYHMSSYSNFTAENAQVSDTTYVSAPDDFGWSGKGSWAPKNSIYYPIHVESVGADISQQQLDTKFSDGKRAKEGVLIAVTDPGWDENPDNNPYQNNTFRVDVIVKKFYGKVNSDAGGNAEWYIQHLTGYGTGTDRGTASSVDEKPSRGSAVSGDEDGFTHTLNASLTSFTIAPLCSGAVVSRPFEKDGNRPGTDPFQPTASDWVKVMYDFGKMIATKRFKDFAMDIVAALRKAAMSIADVDDLMNPICTVLSHSAVSRLYSRFQSNPFTIARRSLGLQCTTWRLSSPPSGWSNYNYVGLYEADNNRQCVITYEFKITQIS